MLNKDTFAIFPMESYQTCIHTFRSIISPHFSAMRANVFLVLAITCSQAACDGEGTNTGKNIPEQVVTETSDPAKERDGWQQPDELLALMGDIRGVMVADLFAGDGYFTF